MKKEMLINVLQSEECRIAILENGILEELYIERSSQENFVGNIYKGRIVNIEPSIQAAFVDFGVGRNGFLHISDVEPAYYRHLDPDGAKYDTNAIDDDLSAGSRDNRPRNAVRGINRQSPVRGREYSKSSRGSRITDRDLERKRQLYQDLANDLNATDNQIPPINSSYLPELDSSIDQNSRPAELNQDITEGSADKKKRGVRPGRGRRGILESGHSSIQNPGNSTSNLESKTDCPEKPPLIDNSNQPPFMGSTEHRTLPPEDEFIDNLLFTLKKTEIKERTLNTEPFSRPVDLNRPILPAILVPTPVILVTQSTNPDDLGEDGELVFTRKRPQNTNSLDSIPLGADQRANIGTPAPTVFVPKVFKVEISVPIPPAEIENGELDIIFYSSPNHLISEAPSSSEQVNNLNKPASESKLVSAQNIDQTHKKNLSGILLGDLGDGSRRPIEVSHDDAQGGRSNIRQPRGRINRDSGRMGGGDKPKPPMQEVFKRGQEVLVQVIKEGIGNKGPTLSTYISIAGRYLVLMPGMNRVGVSRKIMDEDHRRKSKDIFSELKPPKGLGFIIRTAGVGKTRMELQRDLAYLSRLWQVVARRVKKVKSPSEVFQESDIITRTIRDSFTTDIESIWVDERSSFEHAQEFMQFVMPKYADKIKFHDGKEPLFHRFGIEEEITKMHQKKVPLPNGGSIIIEQTEALVAIDVNSGNFRTDGNSSEETAYQMNLAAAKEICRQLRLRDLGGVIVNDFIDMREEKHRRGVEKAMREGVRRDRARTKVLRISAFGLIEMTRQRIRPSLKRSLFTDCPSCRSMGYVKTVESMSLEVLRLLQLATCKDLVSHVLLRLPNGVAEYLLNRKRKELHRLEELGNMHVEILGIPATNPEFIEITAFDEGRNEVRLLPPAPEPISHRHFRR